MSQTNTKQKEVIFGQSKELIQDMTDIIEGHIIINTTRPVAVYKLTPSINPDTLDPHSVQNTISMYQSALNAFAPGEKMQIIVKTKSFDLNKRMSLYDSMTL